MHFIDWFIIGAFVLALIYISIKTNRATKSVAGFLSSERLAGRYLLTVAGSMAFASAIGNVADWEGFYQNGIAGYWWDMLRTPVVTLLMMTGWVIYRYRQTRVLTMAQFLEQRYSRKFRIFAGCMAFVSGLLNCAVFPMVTANFLMYFLALPTHFEFIGIGWSTYHLLMLLMIGGAVTLAIAGGQITIMVTDFLQGTIGSIACISLIVFVAWKFGWTQLIETMANSENIDPSVTPDILEKVKRTEGASVMNPLKLEGFSDFGIAYFAMRIFQMILQTGTWQGGAGYLTAAKSPHESRMGGMLYGWRWLVITMGTIAITMGTYTMLWNPEYAADQAVIAETINSIDQQYLQSQMLVPISLAHMLPVGLIGIFAVYMIGAAVSTDDSAYHSWGSIFLQDVVMPFRKKPFTKQQHLKYLRLSIVGIGAFAFLFSSIWTLKDYIHMWFAVTGAIYVGGASCAIIGGLYWKRGTTAAAWAGLITGSTLAVSGIFVKQALGDDFAIGDIVIHGYHISVGASVIAFTVYFVVSMLTSKGKTFNMDKLLHRGKYAVESDQVQGDNVKRSFFARILGVNHEFSTWDKIIYYGAYGWILLGALAFFVGTLSGMTTEQWTVWWKWHLGIQAGAAIIIGVWFFIGGLRDVRYLFRKLKEVEVDESDDGWVEDKDKD
ncbi:sodium:solute symporter family protein [Pelagicoccus mobilis]|uniref:Sodium:solute symporter n=1 Tax=Pelagicoccus mobilis TaxID=415221 RepID=A0A934RTU1_9BACT|nr:hypothetical protein [Pelagicoccus mobilis]MBK1875280.1 hypothetical protein [Pelagicoccus mobilis]